MQTVSEDSFILGDIVRSPAKQKPVSRAYVRAGVRAHTYFDPATVRAAIVTCGGLCPGLNNVIRELVDTLTYCYGVDHIVGVQHGYWGFHTPDADLAPVRSPNAPSGEPPLLTPAYVAKVHNYGGTVLG
jgi:6-phosphofructokinase 1